MRGKAAASALVCLLLAGCADIAAPATQTSAPATTTSAPTTTQPNETSDTARTASKIARAQATHEYPASRAPAQHATSRSGSAAEAVRRFATAYINWNAQTLGADMRALAAQCIGQARAAVQLAAANSAQDYELRQGGIANSGTVQAVAPLSKGGDRYVVVTLERTTASNTTAYEGLRAAWHVAVATVTELGPGHWVLSGWQPEN
jgi:hypothetical protein